ncbi:MAG TPA: hypothetical protein VNA24_30810 [Hyalangium sp.]|nr:hypothetical protein [Hyalangium sp.]
MSIHRLDEAFLERTIDCVSKLYPRDNLIARALGFTPQDYRPVAERACLAALSADMGLIVADKGTGEVLGFLFCADLIDHFDAVAAMALHTDERLWAWSEIHTRLLGDYEQRFGRPRARGEILYFSITALAPQLHGRSLTPSLVHRATIEFGVQRGYPTGVGIATHPRSRKLVSGAIGVTWFSELAFADLSDPRLRTIDLAARILAITFPSDIASGVDALFHR